MKCVSKPYNMVSILEKFDSETKLSRRTQRISHFGYAQAMNRVLALSGADHFFRANKPVELSRADEAKTNRFFA